MRCGVSASFILDSFIFFEKLQASGSVTRSVTAQRYLRMLQIFIVLQVQLSETLFMQDGDQPQFERTVLQFL